MPGAFKQARPGYCQLEMVFFMWDNDNTGVWRKYTIYSLISTSSVVFPNTESLEDLKAQTKSKWDNILDERKAIGESLKRTI